MPRYIAFLRAINVGGHTVKMDALRKIFTQMGFTDVSTFIASGNVIFDARARNRETLETKIEGELERVLGYDVRTFLRTPDEISKLARKHGSDPGAPDGGYAAHYVTFLKSAPGKALQRRVLALGTPNELLAFDGRELHLRTRVRFADMLFSGAALERILDAPATTRSITTVKKLAALLSG